MIQDPKKKRNEYTRDCVWKMCTRGGKEESKEKLCTRGGKGESKEKTGIENKERRSLNKYSDIYKDEDRLIGPVGRVFANGPGELGSILGRVIPKT